MAIVRGPLLSREASGTLAGTLSFLPGPGPTRVRANTRVDRGNTTLQSSRRAIYKFLVHEWPTIPVAYQHQWDNEAQRRAITPMAAYLSYNLDRYKQGKPPTQQFPPTNFGSLFFFPDAIWTGGFRHVQIKKTNNLFPTEVWGILVHRSTINPAPIDLEHLVHVYAFRAGAKHIYNDTDLAPGTYYYQQTVFDDGGQQGNTSAKGPVIVT